MSVHVCQSSEALGRALIVAARDAASDRSAEAANHREMSFMASWATTIAWSFSILHSRSVVDRALE